MVKMLIPFLLSLSFISPSFAGEITREVSFDKSMLSFDRRDGYDVVRLSGASPIYSPGNPDLPFVPMTFCIPAGARITGVEVVPCQEEHLGEHKILPSQRAKPFSMKWDFPFTAPLRVTYESDEFYPRDIAEIAHVGLKNGFRLATVAVHPLRYRPSSEKLFFYPRLALKIKYEENAEKSTAVAPSLYAGLLRAVKELVVNPQDVERFAPSIKEDGLPSFTLPTGTVEHVIIAADGYEPIFRRLSEWKTKKGVPSRVVPLSYIYSHFSGIDNPDKIRRFITEAHDTWGAQWFLLGGVHDDVPTSLALIPRRDVYCATVGLGAYADEDTIGSDLYYADLDGSWDANGNGVYGETEDAVDMYSDVYVGRAPVKDTAEAGRFVDMVLAYEINPPPAYQPKMLLLSENLFTGYDGKQVSDSIAKYDPSCFLDSKCYKELGLYDDLAAIDSMNLGYGLAHYAGHGNIGGVMYSQINNDPIENGDLDNWLATGTKFGLHYGISCLPGAFDYDCYAEHLLLKPTGGCFSMLNYRFGFGTLDYRGRSEWQDIRFTRAFTTEGYRHFGDAQARMKDLSVGWTSSDIIARWCLYEYNLFADPESRFWTKSPDNLAVTHNSNVEGPASIFVVNVKDDDGLTPIDSALVCLWCQAESTMYVRGYTDINGNVALEVNPSLNGDTMWVTVTKQDYYPYQGLATVTLSAPLRPTVSKLFNFARVCTTTPTLAFSATDLQGDDVEYRVFWDTLHSFAAPESAQIPSIYSSGAVVEYTFPQPLQNGKTYWWRARARDPLGSNCWGLYSEARSFTVENTMPQNSCSWFQGRAAQFEYDELSGSAMVQGDSIILAPPFCGTDTLLDENFNTSASIPVGWSTNETNNNAYDWGVGNTGAAFPPPNWGTYYARISYPIISPAPPVDRDELLTPVINIQPGSTFLYLKYGWGMDYGYNDTLSTWVRFDDGTSWGLWTRLASKAADGSGTDSINLTGFLPAKKLQVKWCFAYVSTIIIQRSGAIDNVKVVDAYNNPNVFGTVKGTPVVFQEMSNTCPRNNWGYIHWWKSSGADSIGLQVEYNNGGDWGLVPDADLPGNSSGFFSNEATGTADITGLSPASYPILRVALNFYRPSAKTSNYPCLQQVEVGSLSESPSGAAAPASGITLPQADELCQNYPNPSAGNISISYALKKKGRVELSIYNVVGQKIRELVGGIQEAGWHSCYWNGRNTEGRMVSNGVYYYRLVSDDFTSTKRMTVIR